MKVDVKRFGCNNLLWDFKFMKNVVKTEKFNVDFHKSNKYRII